MTQISLTSPAAVTILLERSKIFSVAPGISSYVTVAVPAESVAATVSAAADFGPYLADREVTLNLLLGTVVYEVKAGGAGGGTSVTVVNDLTTGGTTSALSAEMGKTLQASKLGASADAIADVLEAAVTGAPADLARIQSSVSVDSIGARLRRAVAAAAADVHPLNKKPLTVALPWTAGEVVRNGVARSNAGNLYIARLSGTCGATAPTGVLGTDSNDGTVPWLYYGPVPSTVNDPDAPTITITTTASGSGMLNTYYPAANPTLFTPLGCTPEVFSTNFWRLKVFDRKADLTSPAYGVGATVSFMTDAAFFVVAFSGSCTLEIDGRMLTTGGLDHSSNRYLWVDYRTNGGKKIRKVTLHTFKDQSNFIGVWVDAYSTVWAAPKLSNIRVACVADSIYAGSAYGPFVPGNMVPSRVWRTLGIDDVWNFSTGGTGWINTNGGLYNYIQRLPQVLASNPDILMFKGSLNETSNTPAEITAAVIATLQAVRDGGFNGPIIGLGIWHKNDGNIPQTEAAVAAGYAAHKLLYPKTWFVPMSADPSGPWVTGSWNNTGRTSATSALLYIAGDNTHPTDLGSAYLADRTADELIRQVVPLIP